MESEFKKLGKNSTEFFKQIAGSTSELFDVDSVIGPNGDFKELKGIDVIIRSITVALYTVQGTYPWNSNYGMGLYRYIFELADERTERMIREKVIETINKYEPRARSFVSVYFIGTRPGFVVDITLTREKEERKVKLVFDQSILKQGSER